MKRLILLLLAVSLTLSLAVPALAATQEGDLIYLDTRKSIVIWVEWDVEQPDVVFLAPDGSEYDPMAQAADTTTAFSGNSLYYIIENASAGQWRIRYDKKGNTQLDVSVHDYQQGLFIERFTTEGPDGSRISTAFQVSGPDGQSYEYRISAMIDHTGTEKVLATGSGTVGREVRRDVNLSGLSTYDGYMLKLYVWYAEGGVDLFDFVYSQPFAYTNTDKDQEIIDFGMVIQPEDHVVTVDWSMADWDVDSVLVAVFEDGGEEPLFFDEYNPDVQTSAQLGYSPTAKAVSVEVSVKVDGVNSAPLRKTAELNRFGLSMTAADAVNATVVPLKYQGMDHQLVSAVVNGYETQLVLTGAGSVNIPLADDWNTVTVKYTDGAGVTWQIHRELFVDRVAPVLTMSRGYDGLVTESKTVTVSGTVVDGETLTVNGQSVAIGENGLFSLEVALNPGANTVTVIAGDALGNESQYVARITCGQTAAVEQTGQTGQEKTPGSLLTAITADGSYWVLLIAGVLCLMVIGYALIFWRKEGKQ